MKNKSACLLGLVLLSGCATRAEDISASYVSPIAYNGLSCSQLAVEAQNVSAAAVSASGAQNKKAGGDAALATVGVVIFWPALLFTSGDGAQAAEVARLKGEMNAIETASRQKGCDIKFNRS
jgi:hypothetical protein